MWTWGAIVSRCNVKTRVDGGCSSFGGYSRLRTTPRYSRLQAELRFTRFPAGGQLHLRGQWRRLGLLVDLCLLFCAVLCPLRFRGDVRRAGGGGGGCREGQRRSGLVSGRYFGVGDVK